MLVKYHLQVGSIRSDFTDVVFAVMLLLLFSLLIFFIGFEVLFRGKDDGMSTQGKYKCLGRYDSG